MSKDGWHDEAVRFRPWDYLDFDVDLGCGKLKKARIGIDRHAAEGVDIVLDLAEGQLPFDDSSIKSIISHHFFEHLYPHEFIRLVDDVYRVLEPNGIFRCITPCFPSRSAIDDPDHKMMLTETTWKTFEGFLDNHWHESFSVPYTKARFEMLDLWFSPLLPVEERWTTDDNRELRVTLRARK